MAFVILRIPRGFDTLHRELTNAALFYLSNSLFIRRTKRISNNEDMGTEGFT